MRVASRTTALAVTATALAAATTTLLPAASYAAAPTRATEDTSFTGVIDSCDGFDVLGDLQLHSTTTTTTAGTETVHLRLTGTVTNAVSGRTGRYAETQVDRTLADGTGFSAGLLSHLTVPGRGSAPVYAGRVTFGPDGTLSYTPHTVGVDDASGFHDSLCGALR